jgi:hypothetical protein
VPSFSCLGMISQTESWNLSAAVVLSELSDREGGNEKSSSGQRATLE